MGIKNYEGITKSDNPDKSCKGCRMCYPKDVKGNKGWCKAHGQHIPNIDSKVCDRYLGWIWHG